MKKLILFSLFVHRGPSTPPSDLTSVLGSAMAPLLVGASRSSLYLQIRQRCCQGDLVHKHKSTFDVTNCHLTEARGCGTICIAVSRGTIVFRQLFSLDFCWWRNVEKHCARSYCTFFTQLHTEEKESHDTLLMYLVVVCPSVVYRTSTV